MFKKVFLIFAMALSTGVIADDTSAKGPAPKEVIDQAIKTCQEYAKEDEVVAEELESYMLVCVNGELEDQGYDKVDSIDK